MAVKQMNPDGTITGETNTLDNRLNITGSSMVMPETKDAIYGAFGDILNIDENQSKGVDPIVYNVYQQRSQQYQDPSMLQYTYGTGVNPVFEWVKTIQSGKRSYNPQNQFDEDMLEKYKEQYAIGNVPDDLMTPDMIMKQVGQDIAAGVAVRTGEQIGRALVDPYYAGKSIPQKLVSGVTDTFSGGPSQLIEKTADLSKSQINVLDKGKMSLANKKIDYTFDPELATKETAAAAGRMDEFLLRAPDRIDLNAGAKGTTPRYAYPQDASAPQKLAGVTGVEDAAVASKGGFTNVAGGTDAVSQSYFSKVGDRLTSSQNWAGAAGAGATNFVVQLAMGADPKKAAKSAAAGTVGTAIGNALLPGIGGVIGGTIGSALGGRVICNELCRKGLIDRKMLINDYKFTRDYLTTNHVNGYHLWAIWMVKQLRQNRFLKLWQHIVTHRGNEIAYIYGERDKPDYLGKIYRKIFEPICWLLGSFCKQTDWSVLYNKKEV